MAELVWIQLEAVVSLHDRSIARHGGAEGVRDLGLLESALARPENLHHYEGVTDIPQLAAVYASAVSSNHPFADGDKRAALLVLALFLRLNGWRLIAGQVEATRTMLALAAGDLDATELTEWVRRNSLRTDP